MLKAEPRLAPVRYQLALAQLQAGNIQQAKSELRETVNGAPNYTQAALVLAELNIRTGATQTAIQDLERLLAGQPSVPGAYALLSPAYLAQGDPGRAVVAAQKFVGLAPKDPRGLRGND